MSDSRCLIVFTKPPLPGRVKTRLIGDLSPSQAAELHAAFFEDLTVRLSVGDFLLRVAWALEPGEELPVSPFDGIRQEGRDLGDRLHAALSETARRHSLVAAVGSDHPDLALERVHRAFERLEAGSPVVIGPASDGGYYLIGFRAEALRREIFTGIEWSTAGVLEGTLERCRELGLDASLLPAADDIDTPEDLGRLARTLASDSTGCPRTRRLLESWNRLPAAP